MPLVLMCGLPSSGKSFRAKELLNYFETSKKCVLIQDDNVVNGFKRNEVYVDAQKEKELRSILKSEVERNLSKEVVVILDAANYIKGYRYELYCLSKGCKTTHCVVHCDTSPSDCKSYNEHREPSLQYNPTVLDALVQRFEPPDPRNRWDSPLFLALHDEPLPLQEVESALFDRKAPPPNLATQNQPLSSTNFLYDLDKITQQIVKSVLSAQKFSSPGDSITIPESNQTILLTNTVSAAELARIRRQFISYTKSHPVTDTTKIPNMFVQFVNKNV